MFSRRTVSRGSIALLDALSDLQAARMAAIRLGLTTMFITRVRLPNPPGIPARASAGICPRLQRSVPSVSPIRKRNHPSRLVTFHTARVMSGGHRNHRTTSGLAQTTDMAAPRSFSVRRTEGDIGLSRQQSTSKWAGPAVVNRTLEAHDDCDSHASRAPNDWFHTTSLRGQLYPGDTSL
jgi:hypothetical protein